MRSAWANVRAYPGRFVAVLLAIAIGVGFTVATLVFTASFRTDLTRSIGAAAEKVDVIVYPIDDLEADDPRLTGIAGLATVEPVYSTSAQFSTPTARGWFGVQSIPTDESLRWFGLTAGSWPTGTDQLVITADTAERNGLAIGSELSLADLSGASSAATVVGIVSLDRSALLGASDEVFVAPEFGSQLAGGRVSEYDLSAADGVTAAALADAARSALEEAAVVNTGAEVVDSQVEVVLGGTDVLGGVLLTFAAIAGLVASFVIANTFTILLAQRQRQLGLLRCVGATRGQIRRSVLAEAVLIGLIGSAGGALLGLGVGRLAMTFADVSGSSFTVQPAGVAIALVVGILVTVMAALAPAARAMRVTPLAALSPVPTMAESTRSGRLRLALGLLLTAAGAAALVAGVVVPSLLIAVGGGAVSAAGILLLLRSALPVVLRTIGRLTRFGGVPGRLAAANAERNPGRAAATSTALVLAVGLIVTLQVAGATARSSLTSALAEHYPLDVSITSDVALPPGLVDQLAGIDGLTVKAVAGADAEVTVPDGQLTMTVLGVPADVATVIRAGQLMRGEVAVPDWMFEESGLRVGDPLTIRTADGTGTWKVADSRLAYGQGSTIVLSSGDLGLLAPAAQPVTIWGKLTDVDDANTVISKIKPLLAPYADLEFGGAAADHVAVEEGLSTILLVVTALLAVAAVIAVVGIGNTLGLSVVERTRESALLRALGLRRGQLRLMLGVEALLLAAVGAVVGIVLGLGYGWIGAAATFGEADEPLTLAFPGGQLLVVLGLALVAGVLASVLPARRAAIAAPTDALAEV